MSFVIRRARPEDAAATGKICHDAFEAISAEHDFPKDFPTPEVATMVTTSILAHPGFYSVVAEEDGKIIGSNFLDERSPIRGVGPITVDPASQNGGAGRALMQSVLDRAAEQRAPGVRLLQDAFHNRSFVLYTKLGFRARATTAVVQGPAPRAEIPGCEVRRATADDLPACDRLCEAVHGHHRHGEVADAVKQGAALVVERGRGVTGYTTSLAFFGHSVGESNDDLKALIARADGFGGPGLHVPTGNDELLRWCFEHGLRVVKQMTLMTAGLYNEPRGVYLPSVGY